MNARQLCFEDVTTGTAITPLIKRPTTVQLFRFSAMTWNSHKIHFDKPHAQSEGYPDVLVQSHLHGSFLVQAVMDWAGPEAHLAGFRWQNRAIAIPGDDAWEAGWAPLLTGRRVSIVFDCDQAGRDAAARIRC